MECSSCAFDGIPDALSRLIKTYTVTVGDPNDPTSSTVPSSLRGSKSTTTRELNPIEYKLARELSKKKPKKDVINALKAIQRDYKRLFNAACDESIAFHKYSQIAAVSNDDRAASLANSIAEDLKTAILAFRSIAPKLQELDENTSTALRKKPQALVSLLDSHSNLVDKIRALIPHFQKICLGCSRASNDDNLSRYGQIFVSIDAMNSLGLIASGADPAADLDDRSDPTDSYNGDSSLNDRESSDDFCPSDAALESQTAQTAHDYLLRHAIVEPHSSDQSPISKLPAHIEDMLRKQLASFNDLDDFEKILCISQWSGQTFSDFGTMKWIPKELKKPQSKQFVRQRWCALVEKFPVAAVLKSGKICNSINSALSKHFSEDAFEQQELHLHSDFDPDSQIRPNSSSTTPSNRSRSPISDSAIFN